MAIGFDIAHDGKIITVTAQQPEITDQQMKQLTEEVVAIIAKHDARHVVVDLGNVRFLDSACMACLIGMLQEVKRVNGHIALVNCQPNVEFLLRMSRLDSLFGLFRSVDEAVASL
jgi:anti-anti-sigma factor